MNLILFEDDELEKNLPLSDPRSVHMQRILKLEVGDEFKAGIIGGMSGIGRLEDRTESEWVWSFLPVDKPKALRPLTLVLGCPRPPVARRLLKDLSSLGLKEIRCCNTDLNEKSYLTSKLWRDGLWRNAVVDGAMQAKSTLLPTVITSDSLERSFDDLPIEASKIALDNVPEAQTIGNNDGVFGKESVLAVGPERGWSDRERSVLDDHGFIRWHLGSRILRTETACILGSGLMLSKMGAL